MTSCDDIYDDICRHDASANKVQLAHAHSYTVHYCTLTYTRWHALVLTELHTMALNTREQKGTA